MKLKIKYDPTTGEILRFDCLPEKVARQKILAKDEIFVSAGDVTDAFYAHWHEFAVIDGTVLPKLHN